MWAGVLGRVKRDPDLSQEAIFWAQGYRLVAGVDEAGRGPWAGPVAAGAVILPPGELQLTAALAGVRDSKQLTPERRDALYDVIHAVALSVGVALVSAARIDEMGIVPATRLAMAQAIARLDPPADGLLIDYLRLPHILLPQRSIPQGDEACLSIAAASIVAKVTRDRLMIELDARYPGYGFARHKGYGTPQHRGALERLGPCAIHRRSFAPVREWLERRAAQ